MDALQAEQSREPAIDPAIKARQVEKQQLQLEQKILSIRSQELIIHEQSKALYLVLHANEKFQEWNNTNFFLTITEHTTSLHKAVYTLLTEVNLRETPLYEQDNQYELCINYLRQGVGYCQRYLDHHLKPQVLQTEVASALSSDQYIRRIDRYLGIMPVHASEIVQRLQLILLDELEQLSLSLPENFEDQEKNA
jgi:hypothetical protein